MSKIVEEAALKAYPEEITTVYGPLPGASAPCIIDSNRPYRIGFKRGYEAAEKDLALTWEDIKTIEQIIATSDWYDFEISGKLWSKEFYEEVLKRYLEAKK